MDSSYSSPSTARRRSFWPWAILLIIVLLITSCTFTVWAVMDKTFTAFDGLNRRIPKSLKMKEGKAIVVLKIEGVIYGTREDIFDSMEEIEEGVDEKTVNGLLLFINSPGGSVAPTQDLYTRILELRKKVPVVCALGDVAASGGYYLATACEQIYAQRGTTTGSIGVIFQLFNLEDLANWAKVKPVTIKSGRLKDIASPFRAMTPEEKTYLQNLLDSVHEQFIKDVALGRANKITEEELRKVADGRIITGEEAIRVGLADKVGGAKDAIRYLEKDKKLGDSELIHLPRPKRAFDSLFTSTKSQNILDQVKPFMGLVPMLLPTYMEKIEAR